MSEYVEPLEMPNPCLMSSIFIVSLTQLARGKQVLDF
jgi:hypothetical protein